MLRVVGRSGRHCKPSKIFGLLAVPPAAGSSTTHRHKSSQLEIEPEAVPSESSPQSPGAPWLLKRHLTPAAEGKSTVHRKPALGFQCSLYTRPFRDLSFPVELDDVLRECDQALGENRAYSWAQVTERQLLLPSAIKLLFHPCSPLSYQPGVRFPLSAVLWSFLLRLERTPERDVLALTQMALSSYQNLWILGHCLRLLVHQSSTSDDVRAAITLVEERVLDLKELAEVSSFRPDTAISLQNLEHRFFKLRTVFAVRDSGARPTTLPLSQETTDIFSRLLAGSDEMMRKALVKKFVYYRPLARPDFDKFPDQTWECVRSSFPKGSAITWSRLASRAETASLAATFIYAPGRIQLGPRNVPPHVANVVTLLGHRASLEDGQMLLLVNALLEEPNYATAPGLFVSLLVALTRLPLDKSVSECFRKVEERVLSVGQSWKGSSANNKDRTTWRNQIDFLRPGLGRGEIVLSHRACLMWDPLFADLPVERHRARLLSLVTHWRAQTSDGKAPLIEPLDVIVAVNQSIPRLDDPVCALFVLEAYFLANPFSSTTTENPSTVQLQERVEQALEIIEDSHHCWTADNLTKVGKAKETLGRLRPFLSIKAKLFDDFFERVDAGR